MATIPAEFEDLFQKRTVAHFATLWPGGAPHVTIVWVDHDRETGHLLVNTGSGTRKLKNVRQNPRAGISMADPDDPYRQLSMTGEIADITAVGAREHKDILANRYLGVDAFPDSYPADRRIVAIKPDRINEPS